MSFDINSKEVKALGFSADQLKKLDAIEDGTGLGSIAQSIFEAAQAYRAGELALGTETRNSWMEKLGDQFDEVVGIFTHRCEYDAKGRLTRETEDSRADGDFDSSDVDVRYTYKKDKNGNQIERAYVDKGCDGKVDHITQTIHDKNGREIEVAHDFDGDGECNEWVYSYEYNNEGKETKETFRGHRKDYPEWEYATEYDNEGNQIGHVETWYDSDGKKTMRDIRKSDGYRRTTRYDQDGTVVETETLKTEDERLIEDTLIFPPDDNSIKEGPRTVRKDTDGDGNYDTKIVYEDTDGDGKRDKRTVYENIDEK